MKKIDRSWHVLLEDERPVEDSSWESPVQAYARQLELYGGGERRPIVIFSSPAFEKYQSRRAKKGLPKLRRRRARVANPRRSKVKDALAAEGLRYKQFSEFAERYWNDCARGIYWIATDEEHFELGPKDAAAAAKGKLVVGCNPTFALMGKNEEKAYVAEINVNRLAPGDIAVKRGTDGAEIKLLKTTGVEILRTIDAEKAVRAFKYQQSLLPSSKEQLRLFWKWAWEREQVRLQKAEDRRLRDRDREIRRKEKGDRADRKVLLDEAKREKKKRDEALKKGKRKNPGVSTRTRLVPSTINNPCSSR